MAVDWPVLAPWYDHVERHAGISGSVEGLPQLPDGQFQPAMPLNCAEEMIAGRLARKFGGHRRLIPGRTANLTQPLGRRGRCQYRNAGALGCPHFRDDIRQLDEACRTAAGVSFMRASPAHYFRMIKELALLSYFTSEMDYTRAMRYIESPGRFDPCALYAPGDRSWAPYA